MGLYLFLFLFCLSMIFAVDNIMRIIARIEDKLDKHIGCEHGYKDSDDCPNCRH